MLAASINQDLIIQANRALNKPRDLSFPGLFENNILLVKIDNKDGAGLRGVMAAMIAQAGKDAARGDQEAAAWLAGDMCFDYCYALGFEHENIELWLKEKISQ